MKLDLYKNAKKNIVFSLINKIIVVMCPFLVRTLVQNVLGAEYLGLGSLFVSIISVLSLAELGFTQTVVYNMYKPIAENDVKSVNELLSLYRKAYKVIGIVILVIGLLLLPFLPYLIKGTYPSDINIYYLYLIYLGNAVISYLMYAYLGVIITVHQREDINSSRNSIVTILLSLAKIMVLLVSKNFYLFTLMIPLFTIINNLWIAGVVRKEYPQYYCCGTVSKEKKQEIKKLIYGSFIQNVCGTTRNSLDSICISAFLGLTLTAIYYNYFYIMAAVGGVITIIGTSITGGIGNHVAIKSKEENFSELCMLDFIYMLLSGWCCVCLVCLYQTAMKIWMGEEMMLGFSSVILFAIYFYLLRAGDMRHIYSSANGLWWEQRWRAIVESITNIILNIVLGRYFGVNGIIMATIISIFFCSFIWGGKITFKMYFGKERKYSYYKYQLKYFLITMVVCGETLFFCELIQIQSIYIKLLLKCLVCLFVPTTTLFLIYRKEKLFKIAKEYLLAKRRQI